MVITFLYICAAAISSALGLYCLFSDIKRKENRIFLLLTLTISLWAFDYALMNISENISFATLFHRIGSIFYSLFYAIFLHFIVLITKNENKSRTKRIFQNIIIYIPALFSLILYFFISPVTIEEHFRTPLGWGNINSESKSVFVVHYHTVYYLIYTIIALYLLFKWGKQSITIKEKRQAKLLIIGIVTVLFLGVITDTIFPSIRLYPLPPMGSIELIIPIILSWHAIRKYSLMLPHIDIQALSFLKTIKAGIIILDNENNIIEISDGALLLLNLKQSEINFESLKIYLPYIQENGLKEVNNILTYLINDKGFKIPILLIITYIFDKYNDRNGSIIIFEDISEMLNLQNQLKELNENLELIVNQRTKQLKYEIEQQILERKKYQALFENSHDAVAESDEKGYIKKVNKRFVNLFEYEEEEIIGKHIDDIVIDEDRKEEGLEITKKTLENNIIVVEGIRKTKSNRQIYTIVKGVPIIIDGKVIGGFAIYTDITKDKENEMKLKIMAQRDSLTGLFNLNQYGDYINSSNLEDKLPLGIIVSDINGLKFINDSFGHDVGDKLLKIYAKILLNSVRKDDLVFRIGGDEFLILINNTKEDFIKELVQRIQRNIEKFNEESEEKMIIVDASLGYSLLYEKEKLKHEFKKADDMMYRNKMLNKSSNKNTILKVLLSALSEKDYITAGHTDRVLEICKKIAQKMNLDNDKKDKLFLLSEVHDIGKIAIPDSILNKPGKLNDEEWEIMKTHCEKGYRIAINSEELLNVADLILKHHERWDGNGYPLGLKGEDIPIECRILSIIDSYDAMISQRPYNKIKTKEEAIDEIINGSEKQYDPFLVNVFIKVVKENY